MFVSRALFYAVIILPGILFIRFALLEWYIVSRKKPIVDALALIRNMPNRIELEAYFTSGNTVSIIEAIKRFSYFGSAMQIVLSIGLIAIGIAIETQYVLEANNYIELSISLLWLVLSLLTARYGINYWFGILHKDVEISAFQ